MGEADRNASASNWTSDYYGDVNATSAGSPHYFWSSSSSSDNNATDNDVPNYWEMPLSTNGTPWPLISDANWTTEVTPTNQVDEALWTENVGVTTWSSTAVASLGIFVQGDSSSACHQEACESHYNWYFLLLLVFVVGGGLGNTLVCLAIGLDRKLQNVTNYFLLSLAVADLLVSLVVMPFSIVVGFLGYWPFGPAMCNVYVTCDVLACSSSILHMCFISIGRYLGIRNPLKNRGATTSKKLVLLKVLLVWLLAASITSPITLLAAWDGSNVAPQPLQCAISNRFFFVFGSLVAFYVPMLFMVVSYVLTVQLLRQQELVGGEPLPARRVRLGTRRNIPASGTNIVSKAGGVGFDNGHQTRPRTRERSTQTDEMGGTTCEEEEEDADGGHWRRSLRRHLSVGVGGGRSRRRRRLRERPSLTVVAAADNERKASKVLGLVFSTFVVCWVPFFALNIFLASCPSCPVAGNIVDTCLWLGYASSTINPLIYTIFNRTFKEAFVRLLLCRCRQLHRGGRRHPMTAAYRYAQRAAAAAPGGPLLLLSPTSYDGRMQTMSMC